MKTFGLALFCLLAACGADDVCPASRPDNGSACRGDVSRCNYIIGAATVPIECSCVDSEWLCSHMDVFPDLGIPLDLSKID